MKRMIWAEIKMSGKQIIIERYRATNGRVMETVEPTEAIYDSQEFDCIDDDNVIVAFQAL